MERSDSLYGAQVTTEEASLVGRILQAKITELGLANIPGNTSRGAAGYDGSRVLVYWPSLIDRTTQIAHGLL